MTYEQALAFWFGRINYEQRSPGPDDLKLDRMRALLRLLGDPQDRLRIVHVAGSKGKGSTAAMLGTILGRAGYRTGLFTSPHLCRPEERIQVDGAPITAAELVGLMEEIAAKVMAAQHLAAAPTFFEIATALGFLHFVRRRVEVAVIEVGLGGRFDSTNVCLPLVALISSISFDHTQQLGNRLGSIAMEKAGIIKPGRPAISGAQPPEACQVIAETCRRRAAPLRQLGVHFHYIYEPGRNLDQPPDAHAADAVPRWPRVRIHTDRRAWPEMELALVGEHQAANAAVAVACVEELQAAGLAIDDAAVARGLSEVRWPARLEVLGYQPLVMLDCAHNVASARALVDALETSFAARRRLLIFAGSTDKDLAGILAVLAPHFTHAFLTAYGNSPRSASPGHLAALLGEAMPFTLCPTAGEAWRAARAMAGADDLICITGSLFLAGELRPLLTSA